MSSYHRSVGTGVRIHIEGARTANRNLKEFDEKIRRRIVQSAVRAGCAEIRKEARSRAPVRTGALRKQIGVSVKTDKVRGIATGHVRPKRSKAQRRKGFGVAARYIHLVVGGTRPHPIPSQQNESAMLRFGGQFYSRVEHPGARAQPFMDAAASSAMRPALGAFAAKMDERILKEAAKMRAASRSKKA